MIRKDKEKTCCKLKESQWAAIEDQAIDALSTSRFWVGILTATIMGMLFTRWALVIPITSAIILFLIKLVANRILWKLNPQYHLE